MLLATDCIVVKIFKLAKRNLNRSAQSIQIDYTNRNPFVANCYDVRRGMLHFRAMEDQRIQETAFATLESLEGKCLEILVVSIQDKS